MEMNPKQRAYFEDLVKYNPRYIKAPSDESAKDIIYLLSKVKDVAKDALSEEISLNNAKKEITDLLNNIELLKKGKLKNVTLG